MSTPFNLNPPPLRIPLDQKAWLDWFRDLQRTLTSSLVTWSSIDFTGSNITSIVNRRHRDLDDKQGGTTNEYYHLTSAEYSELVRSDNVTSTAVNLALDDTHSTVVVTASGKTITLPAASTARVGKSWTVNFTTTGTCNVVAAGSDTFATPDSATETTLIMTERGQSHTFRCLTATTWGIV